MTDGLDDLPERVQNVENKVDALSISLESGFDRIDAALVEQRAYTEFAFERLDSKVDAGFAQVSGRFAGQERKMDGRFAQLERQMDNRFRQVDGRIDRLERKIDQVLELHLPKDRPDSD